MIVEFQRKHSLAAELIDIIQSFPNSARFCQWIGGADFKIHILSEKVVLGNFEIIAECYINDLKVCLGGAEVSLAHIEQTLRDLLENKRQNFMAELLKLRKERVSTCLLSKNYTTLSDVYSSLGKCGSCWDIYDMAHLSNLYKAKGLKSPC